MVLWNIQSLKKEQQMRTIQGKQLHQYCVGPSLREGPLHMVIYFIFKTILMATGVPARGSQSWAEQGTGLDWPGWWWPFRNHTPSEGSPCHPPRPPRGIAGGWRTRASADPTSFRATSSRLQSSQSCSFSVFPWASWSSQQTKFLPSRLTGRGLIAERGNCLDLSMWFQGKEQNGGDMASHAPLGVPWHRHPRTQGIRLKSCQVPTLWGPQLWSPRLMDGHHLHSTITFDLPSRFQCCVTSLPNFRSTDKPMATRQAGTSLI